MNRLAYIACALTAACATPDDTAHEKPQRPNIVLILADDMGYGDVGTLNPTSRIPTPHLDGMARAGMTFTDAHTPSAVCTPTRYGLLTGRYCWRGRLKRGVLNGYSPRLIETGRKTIGNVLQDAGYHTGIVGKWHLGLGFRKQGKTIDFEKPVADTPNVLGFDESFIIPASLDFPPYVYIRNDRVTEPEVVPQPKQRFPAFLRRGPRAKDLVMANALHDLTQEAVAFIEKRAATDAPFFLYFPLTAPHKPTLPHPDFRGKTKLGPYGDFITQVDWTVGRVLQALRRTAMHENTLVIYTSDNGSYMRRGVPAGAPDHVADETVQAYAPANHRANGPLRGTKADIWEAGHRVPFLAQWPRAIAAGSKCTTTLCLTDVMATFAELTDVALDADMGEDSYSFLPLLRGGATARPPVIHHSAAGMFAIRDGRFKLVAGNGSGGRARPKGKPFQRPFQLFDLEQDLGEANDVLAQHPDVAARLAKQLEAFRTAGRSVATAK